MKRTSKIFLLAVLTLLLLNISGCKTPPELKGVVEPFGVIGENAAAYIYIPVKGNEKLIEKGLPLASGKDMKKAFKRTNKIFSGIFFNGLDSEIRICAKGKYPYKFSGSIFKKKKGWTPKKTKEGYKYYESDFVDISIPSASIACIDMGRKNRQKMPETLSKLKNPIIPKFPRRFKEMQHSDSSEIGIFVKQPDFFLSQILGIHLGLPLGKIQMYLKKDDKNSTEDLMMYTYTLTIEVNNPRTATVLKLFLRKMLDANVKIEDNLIKIENRSITEEKIIDIIQSLYPY